MQLCALARRSLVAAAVLGTVAALAVPSPVTAAASASGGPPGHLPGLTGAASIVRDVDGVAHIRAGSLHDAFFLQGWVHAQDRLFQMDVNRRLPSGTLAELVGSGALPSDVQMRTIGLRRAAERSWAVAPAELRAVLQAYADGVNAYVASHPLPREYGDLGLTSFEPWTPVDSLVVGKLIAFGLSFDLDIGLTVQLQSYIAAGQAHGFDGAKLFFDDLVRSEPFSHASTVPDSGGPTAPPYVPNLSARQLTDLRSAAQLGKAYLARVDKLPLFRRILNRDNHDGSNEWGVAGSHTVDGRPIVANDPHLSLSMPSTFYPIGIEAGSLDVEGEGFAGAPGVVIGHNKDIAWGATTNPMDVTDTYREQIVPDASAPSGFATVYQGHPEPVQAIPESYRVNVGGTLQPAPPGSTPPFTYIVPRRNNGPILQLGSGSALSVQYTGFSPTEELQTFLIWDSAKGLADFQRGLQFFDFGSQNWAYADRHGHLAYFTSGEMPVREDLQAGTVHGLPPYFIRDGTGGNEWLPVEHPQPHQAVPYEILPASQMPHVIDPPNGWFVNANNDPAGTTLDNDPLNQLRPGGGIYYLNPGYDGFRAGRITQMLQQRLAAGPVSTTDMEQMQADTTLLDAEYFVPWIDTAYGDATTSAVPQLQALAADPAVTEAVQRLGSWDFTTPTGVPQGYDANDVAGVLGQPSATEVADSVAATVYSEWRSRFITHVIDDRIAGLPVPDSQQALEALKHLLDTFDTSHGVGASGVPFFAVPGISDPAAARDYLVLASVKDALDRLAGPNFDAAFHGSTDIADYRWGLLHRLVLRHVLGGPYDAPPAFGQFPAPLPGLDGVPVDGGFETVDAASHDARANDANGFMFDGGPARRFVAAPGPGHWFAESALPGGTSADPTSPYYLNLLRPYLTDEYYPARLWRSDIARATASVTKLVP